MIRNALSLAALSILLLTTAGQPGWAASFDCAKAETADERAVCADSALNDEDVEMAVLYSRLKPLLGMGPAVTWRMNRSPGSSDALAAAMIAPA